MFNAPVPITLMNFSGKNTSRIVRAGLEQLQKHSFRRSLTSNISFTRSQSLFDTTLTHLSPELAAFKNCSPLSLHHWQQPLNITKPASTASAIPAPTGRQFDLMMTSVRAITMTKKNHTKLAVTRLTAIVNHRHHWQDDGMYVCRRGCVFVMTYDR